MGMQTLNTFGGWLVEFLAAQLRMIHALAWKGGWVGESGDCRLHGVGGEAVGNVQHNVPVFEWELEGRVALVVLVGQQKVDQVVEEKDWR